MRKLKFISPIRCDILIFDTIGANWIHHCLPPECTVGHLNIRDQFPLIPSFRFCLRLIHHFIRQDKTTPGYRSLVWLSALFDHICPQVIFTCADNNRLVSLYSQNNPEIQVVYLQNAIRDTIGSIPSGIDLPIYLAMGTIEKEIFRKLRIQCQDYRPVGSVKLGLALSLYRGRTSIKNEFDLCFISHYRPELFYHNAPELSKKIAKAHNHLFENLINYAIGRNLTLAVASKTRDVDLQDGELEYFFSIAKNYEFSFIRGDKSSHEFDTYRTAFASELVVDLSSTLGFELLSAGLKVLFGASQEPELLIDWGIEPYFDVLPNLIKLRSRSMGEFTETCDGIRQMSDLDYSRLTTNSAQTIVTMPKGKRPHEVVRKILSDCLK